MHEAAILAKCHGQREIKLGPILIRLRKETIRERRFAEVEKCLKFISAARSAGMLGQRALAHVGHYRSISV
ncbi:protein of unknown function [Methylocella tundrae]|uniref:Uncharacterized protein n=1 Tax=Methylocella tundrae TaxID=227605 RepID=A0A4U8Z1U8_METTU|nr:protein of unknown function [Methylocella tundrae]